MTGQFGLFRAADSGSSAGEAARCREFSLVGDAFWIECNLAGKNDQEGNGTAWKKLPPTTVKSFASLQQLSSHDPKRFDNKSVSKLQGLANLLNLRRLETRHKSRGVPLWCLNCKEIGDTRYELFTRAISEVPGHCRGRWGPLGTPLEL